MRIRRIYALISCSAFASAVLAVPTASSMATATATAAAPLPGTISTIAGGTGPALATAVALSPRSLATFGSRVYIGDEAKSLVRVLDTTTGRQQVYGGGGGVPGETGPATSIFLGTAAGMAVDGAGNLFMVDGQRVRKIDTLGRLSVVAGTADYGFAGDGGPATAARLFVPSDVALDGAGNLFIADEGNRRVRRVDPAGIITTVAGGGDAYRTTGPATGSTFYPKSLAVDAAGSVYVAEIGAVRKVDRAGNQSVVLDPSTPWSPSEASPGLASGRPDYLAFDAAGTLYAGDAHRIVRLNAAGQLETVAGTGAAGFSGDGGPAKAAAFSNVGALRFDGAGNLFVADRGNFRVRRVTPGGIVSTVAGMGSPTFSGDGGPATDAMFHSIFDVATDEAGNVYIGDNGNRRVRKVDAAGMVTTFAGNGATTPVGDGGPATAAGLGSPAGLAFDAAGNLYIADLDSNRLRKVTPGGTISTVAGNGDEAFSGDGGPAIAAGLDAGDVAVGPNGELYVLDVANRRVRRIDPDGKITTVVGNGDLDGPAGEGRPGPSVPLAYATGIAVDGVGRLHVSRLFGGVWRLEADGTIHTVEIEAGYPFSPAFDGDGRLYVASLFSATVNRLDATGRVTVVAGNGTLGFGGDGGPATQAMLRGTSGLAFYGADLYIADGAWRVRKVTAGAPPLGLRSWGLNQVGQLGNADPATVKLNPSPVSVGGLTGVMQVASGSFHNLALRSDGTVWAWGWNGYGQLGNATMTDSTQPVRVSGLSRIVAVAAGAVHSLAVDADGQAWAWGWNGYGQLGNGTTTDSATPVKVLGVVSARGLAGGAAHSLAVLKDGTVKAWGLNNVGQLGEGTSINRTLAVPVPGLTGVTQVAAGWHHSAALLGDRTVRAWGWNPLGQVGDGTLVDRRTPVVVTGLTGVTALAAGLAHTLALREDNRLWGWGWNGVGQLGAPSDLNPLFKTATELSWPGGVVSIAAGAYHSVAITWDGKVWTWGWNVFAQAGDGKPASPQNFTAALGTASGLISAGWGHTIG